MPVAGFICGMKDRLVQCLRWRHLPAAVLLLLAISGCASTEHRPVTGKAARPYARVDPAQITLPSYVTSEVRDAYEYALTNPDKLRYMPCYCGCGLTAGHKSNLDCYFAGVDEEGKVAFTDHAVHCDVCVEITRDVKRLSAGGKPLKEVRAYIDQTHGQKGPSTDTPLPPS
ncbi:MAG: hypothetical protein HYX92_12035 [Chloroflexi bacterium]|nr:hypothetical protein [Chloroflexota bacterium]